MICSAGRETEIKPSKARMAKVGIFSFADGLKHRYTSGVKVFTFVVCILYSLKLKLLCSFWFITDPSSVFIASENYF